MLLKDVHLLVIDNISNDRSSLVNFLEQEGAICHVAKTRVEAMGLYMALFTDNIVPRAIITEWYLNPPGSMEFEFYNKIGKSESNTAVNLIRRLRIIDPDVAIIVHSAYLDDMIHEGLPVHVVQKGQSYMRIVDILEGESSITRRSVKI